MVGHSQIHCLIRKTLTPLFVILFPFQQATLLVSPTLLSLRTHPLTFVLLICPFHLNPQLAVLTPLDPPPIIHLLCLILLLPQVSTHSFRTSLPSRVAILMPMLVSPECLVSPVILLSQEISRTPQLCWTIAVLCQESSLRAKLMLPKPRLLL